MDAQTEDFLQILRLIDLERPLNRLGGWAASADFIKIIYKELFKLLEKKDDLHIVECGSGVSTVLVGKFLKKYAPNTKLITLDHDYNYYLKTLDELKMHKLFNVELVYAPLKPYEIEKEVWLWYEDTALKNLERIDVLIVDGPPMTTQKDARYPALPILFSKFSKDTVVLLDDAAREDERNIVKRWKKEYGLLEEFIENEKGTSILKRWEPQEKPLVTIAIPTYNRVEFLKEAVASALEQSYEQIEVIVCDDGSDIDIKRELESIFDDKRLRIIVNEKNMGRPYTRNRLIQEAKGEYILWLDDDDILEVATIKEYLEAQEEIGGQGELFYGNLQMFGNEQGTLRPYEFFLNNQLLGYQLFSKPGSPLPNPFTMVKKQVYERVGEYDERFLRAQDYEFWARAWDKVVVKKVEKIVGFYRIHENNISAFGLIKSDRSYESMAIRKNFDEIVIENAFVNISQKNAFSQFAKLLESYFDYTNALFYFFLANHMEQMKQLAYKIGDIGLLKRLGANDEKVEKLLKNYIKLLKILKRDSSNEALVQQIEAQFGLSWITLFAKALYYLPKDRKQAYEYARASMIANPFSKESKELMQELGKDEEVAAIVHRLTHIANDFEKSKPQFLKEYFGV